MAPLLVGAGWFVAVVNGATCREQLLSSLAPGLDILADWIDQDTPDTACTKQLCTNTQFSVCNPASSSVPTENMVGCVKGGTLHPTAYSLKMFSETEAFCRVKPGYLGAQQASECCGHLAGLPCLQVLVFSDEFNEDGRKFGAADKDPRWTAMVSN